jgi:hypothetical protein
MARAASDAVRWTLLGWLFEQPGGDAFMRHVESVPDEDRAREKARAP